MLKKFSGTIVNNTIRHEILAAPEPKNVKDDVKVTKDCGFITRVKNENDKLITVLAGSMTIGVWVSAKMMTEYDSIEKWYRKLNLSNDKCEFQIVFENNVQNILRVEPEDIKILKARLLVE